MDTFKSSLLKSLYNNPVYSDAELIFNGKSYYLMLPVLKEYAPLLYTEFEKNNKSVDPSTSSPAPSTTEELISSLSSIISKAAHPKKTVTISEPLISNDILDEVLQSLYDKPFEITTEKLDTVYRISIKFGINTYNELCTKFFNNSINADTFVENYQLAIDEKSPLESLYRDLFAKCMYFIPENKVLNITGKMSYDNLKLLVSTNNDAGDFVWNIVENWCNNHTTEYATTDPRILDLFTSIKLELLTTKTILTKVKTRVDSGRYLAALESYVENSIPKIVTRRKVNNFLAVGRLDGKYADYKLVTKNEINDKFRKFFIENYDRQEGLFCLETFTADVLCCSTNPLMIDDNNWVRFKHDDKNLVTSQYKKLSSSYKAKEDTYSVLKNIGVSCDTISTSGKSSVGLFVPTFFKFD
mgnify:FL=1